MATRGKILANLSLAKSRPNQEEGFLSKCKRYLASLPSQDKNAKMKLNFVLSSGDQLSSCKLMFKISGRSVHKCPRTSCKCACARFIASALVRAYLCADLHEI